MDLRQEKIEELIDAANKIIAANETPQEDLFGSMSNSENLKKIFALPQQDPEKSYDLYYQNIQKFLFDFLPKDNDITSIIRELVCILLSHKERTNLSSGRRGADSRQATTEDMENLIDVLSEWASTPTDYFKLANILLEKSKKLKYVPQERRICDYIKSK